MKSKSIFNISLKIKALPTVIIYGVIILTVIGSIIFSSCRHNRISGDHVLDFSSDTIFFDTVFTTVSSGTRTFTVRNTSSEAINVDIVLAGGKQSYYSMNVDGEAGTNFSNVEIPARDSIYIFVKVNINPTNQNNPYLVTDSIVFRTEKEQSSVQLVACGQDAHFILPNQSALGMKINIIAHEHEHVHWTNDKPWVIYGWAAIDSLGKLTIDPGTKVYVHNGGGIWVYRYGSIHINGTVDQPVEIRGDRLEPFFSNDCAQWDRIWICEGNQDNLIENAVITNAAIGLQFSALSEYTGNRNIVKNTIIQNNQMFGVLAQVADLEMTNCQVSNNGQSSLLLQIGDFEINHVTVANFYTQGVRKYPAVVLQNNFRQAFMDTDGSISEMHYLGNTNATFNNTVIYGSLNNEFSTSTSKEAELNYTFTNCLVKRDSINNSRFINCFNKDPKFTDKYRQDYSMEEESPLIDAGVTNLGITTDLLGRPRNGIPDIGAYEYYPTQPARR